MPRKPLSLERPTGSSSGSVSAFSGRVDTPAALVAALQARSMGQEVVFMADMHLLAMQQAYALLTRVGVHHVLVMALDAHKCEAMLSVHPALGCCWSTMGLPKGVAGSKRMAALRAITAARIVALGYNLLLLDADTMVLRNPYAFLRHPPFSTLTLLAMRGAMPRTASSGVLYVQGADRSGPVALMMEEVAVRMLRWAEYGRSTARAAGSNRRALAEVAAWRGTSGRRAALRLNISSAFQGLQLERVAAGVPEVGAGRRVGTGGIGVSRRALQSGAAAGGAGGSGGVGGGGGGALLHAFANAAPSGCPEALLMTDALLSVRLSKGVHWNCFRPSPSTAAALGVDPRRLQEAGKQWDEAHVLALGLGAEGFKGLFTRQIIKNETLQSLVMAKSYPIYSAALKVASSPATLTLPPALADHAVYLAVSQHKDGVTIAALRRQLQADRAFKAPAVPAAAARQLLRSSSPSHASLHDTHTAREQAQSAQQEAWRSVSLAGTLAPWVGPDKSFSHSRHTTTEAAGPPAAATDAGGEVFAFAPDWLFGGWHDRGAAGYWSPGLSGDPPRQVVAHLGRAPGAGGGAWSALQMAYGLFDWDAVHRQERASGGSTAPGALPKLVALAPSFVDRLAVGVMDAAATGQGAWQAALRGLAQVAALTGRTPVWPDLPCNTSWLGAHPGAGGRLPLKPNTRVLPYGTSLQSLRCIPIEHLNAQCLHVFSSTWLRSPWPGGGEWGGGGGFADRPFRGMLGIEAAHVTDLLAHWGGTGGSTEANTVRVGVLGGEAQQALREKERRLDAGNASWWEMGDGRQEEEGPHGMFGTAADGLPGFFRVKAAEVERAAGSVAAGFGSHMDGHLVVYLDGVVVVEDLPPHINARVQSLQAKCPAFAH